MKTPIRFNDLKSILEACDTFGDAHVVEDPAGTWYKMDLAPETYDVYDPEAGYRYGQLFFMWGPTLGLVELEMNLPLDEHEVTFAEAIKGVLQTYMPNKGCKLPTHVLKWEWNVATHLNTLHVHYCDSDDFVWGKIYRNPPGKPQRPPLIAHPKHP